MVFLCYVVRKKLAFGYIPPKAIGNIRPVKMHNLEQIIERKENI